MYKLIRFILFQFSAEKAHYVAMGSLKFICKLPFGKKIITKLYTPKYVAPYSFLQMEFRNRIGLAAGFDKNAKYLNELDALGFGHVEIGTVTPLPQDGNPKPRLFRLKKDRALINRMGFNNDGVEEIVKRLKVWRNKSSKFEIRNSGFIIGGNIGKNKNTPNDKAWMDYVTCFDAMHPYVDYFVVNVSSPNTPGLRALQEKDSLQLIFSKLKAVGAQLNSKKPILLKIAPDLTTEQVDDVVDLIQEMQIDGLVVSNTTLDRSNLTETGKHQANYIGMGGLSGKPITQKATELIHYIHTKCNGQIPIIGSGGIFTQQDATVKYLAGASMLQVWTGFIYEGPSIVNKLVYADKDWQAINTFSESTNTDLLDIIDHIT